MILTNVNGFCVSGRGLMPLFKIWKRSGIARKKEYVTYPYFVSFGFSFDMVFVIPFVFFLKKILNTIWFTTTLKSC